jgi:hypothetical protein
MVTPPERSGSDLLMQSAGLLIICHMREETTEEPTNLTHDGIVLDRFIGRIHLVGFIVKPRRGSVKYAQAQPLKLLDAQRP